MQRQSCPTEPHLFPPQSPQRPTPRPITRADYPFLISPASTPPSSRQLNWEQWGSSCFTTPSRSSPFDSSFDSSHFRPSRYLSSSQKTVTSPRSTPQLHCKRLKKHTFLEQNECSICLEPIREKATLPCNHHYCLPCLQRWMDSSTTCPYCRTPFVQYIYNGQTHQVKEKAFEYHPSNEEVLDWVCYRCELTQEGDVILICDRCEAYGCHVECDETLGGVEPIGEWYCHECRS